MGQIRMHSSITHWQSNPYTIMDLSEFDITNFDIQERELSLEFKENKAFGNNINPLELSIITKIKFPKSKIEYIYI